MNSEDLHVVPVTVGEDEHVPLPSGSRSAVLLTDGEDHPAVGLRCAFCDHYYTEFGSGSMMGVVQVQVSQNGQEAKRWGGGELVWQCNRCRLLKRRVTLDGRLVITVRVPEATVEQVREHIGNAIYGKVQSTKW
jgi:hypothetical protein